MVSKSPKILPIELVVRMIRDRDIAVDAGKVADLVDEANANSLLVPAGKLDFVLRGIRCMSFAVGQGSLQQFNAKFLPGMVFLEGRWRYLMQSDAGISMEDPDTGQSVAVDPANLPIAVVLWLKPVSHNYMGQPEESYGTARSLVVSMALKQKRWLVDVSVATLLVNVFAVVTSLFAMQVYDRVVPTLAYYTLYALVIGVTGIYVFDWVLKLLRSNILDYYASHVDKVDIGIHLSPSFAFTAGQDTAKSWHLIGAGQWFG